MYNMMNNLKDKAQRFTISEIQAEILRQRIQELGMQEREDDNDPQTQADTQKLERLKRRLADVEVPAQLNARGRVLIGKYWDMMNEIKESYEVPSGADEILDQCCKLMDTVEDERRRRHLRDMDLFRKAWPGADWAHRGQMVRWLGTHGIRRFGNEKPRYHVGRVAIGLGMKMMKWKW